MITTTSTISLFTIHIVACQILVTTFVNIEFFFVTISVNSVAHVIIIIVDCHMLVIIFVNIEFSFVTRSVNSVAHVINVAKASSSL